MKKILIVVIVGLIAYYIYLRMLLFRPFVHPFVRRKCDAYGCGGFGASRDSGKRGHKGMDVVTSTGQKVFAPFGGKIRTFEAYEGYSSLLGVEVKGASYKVKLMYVLPVVKNGDRVKAGQLIGYAQSLQMKYPGISDHIHAEVWRYGSILNPSPHFPPDSIV